MDTITDPRPEFATALATAGHLVAAVRPDQLDLPTPCDEYDVRALLGHLLNVLDRITAIGRGADPFALALREVADGFVAEWKAAAADLEVVWADDAALAIPSPLPWAPGTGADVLISYVSELTVHSWDLATATGQAVAWDDEVVALAASRMEFLPPTDRAAIFAPIKANLPPHLAALPDPFRDAVPVAADAPLIDRLVAWNGRQP
jgi:uncharacterized protein (TIGR03086 family)